MNIFCPLLPIQVKPAFTKGKSVLYNTIATNISGDDVPRKSTLCKCQPLAAQSNTPTAPTTSSSTSPSSTPTPTEPRPAEPTNTSTFTSSSSTPTPTEPRPLEPIATELIRTEDKPEAAWRASLKRSIEALEVDLKQKEREVQAIEKKIKVLKEQL